MQEQIKNNLHSKYYFDIDLDYLSSFFQKTSYQELDEKNINDTLINLSDYIKYLISSQFNVK